MAFVLSRSSSLFDVNALVAVPQLSELITGVAVRNMILKDSSVIFEIEGVWKEVSNCSLESALMVPVEGVWVAVVPILLKGISCRELLVGVGVAVGVAEGVWEWVIVPSSSS